MVHYVALWCNMGLMVHHFATKLGNKFWATKWLFGQQIDNKYT